MQIGTSGHDIEQRLQTKLGMFCNLERGEALDHQYKLDFVIHSFKDIIKFGNTIGVQVTTNVDELSKQSEFLRVQRQRSVVPKAVFLEIDSQTPINEASNLAYFALAALAFGCEYQEKKITGLRIRRDLSFEFFDIEENIKRLEEEARKKQPSEPQKTNLSGGIRRYQDDKGFGFLSSDQGNVEFFFHRNNIVDTEVEYKLDHDPGEKRSDDFYHFKEPIRVFFDHGGFKQGQKRPQAINIRATP